MQERRIYERRDAGKANKGKEGCGKEEYMKRGIHDWSYAGLERYRKECSRQE